MSRYRAGLLAGSLISVVIFCVGSVIVFERIQRSRRAMLEGLLPEAVLVARIELAEGAPLKLTDLSLRSVPVGAAGGLLVSPYADLRWATLKTQKPVREGDPLLQSDLRVGYGEEVVLFAARDIAPGTLDEKDVVARVIPKRPLGNACVRASQKEVFFRRVTTRISQGDPVLWSNFDQVDFDE